MKCINCEKDVETLIKKLCASCYYTEIQQKRILLGLCKTCGKRNNTQYTRCSVCNTKNNLVTLKKYRHDTVNSIFKSVLPSIGYNARLEFERLFENG